MTDVSARPHRRELLGWGRSVVKTPQWHSRSAVWEACDVLIRFGTLDDIANVSQLRAAIEAGEVRPGAAVAPIRRWIKIAALSAILIWVIVWIIAGVADAQAAGRLPSVVEWFR